MAVVMTAILILKKQKKSTPKEGEGMKVSCYIITPSQKIDNNIDVVQNASCHSEQNFAISRRGKMRVVSLHQK